MILIVIQHAMMSVRNPMMVTVLICNVVIVQSNYGPVENFTVKRTLTQLAQDVKAKRLSSSETFISWGSGGVHPGISGV